MIFDGITSDLELSNLEPHACLIVHVLASVFSMFSGRSRGGARPPLYWVKNEEEEKVSRSLAQAKQNSQIFILLIFNGERIFSNVNVVVLGQVKSENSSLTVVVRVSKTRVLKLPIFHSRLSDMR